MTFNDIQIGNPISITVSNNGKQVTLNSNVINIVDETLIVEPFISNGNFLNFPRNMEIEMLVVRENDTPLYWQKVYIDPIKFREQSCHQIRTNLPGIKYNRRSSFRVPLTVAVTLKPTMDTSAPAVLKDLSVRSYSILVAKNIDLELHKKIAIEYSDKANDKFFELAGRPVRKSELQNYNLYGCIMDKRYPDLENYLAQKQLELRRGRQ